MEKMCLKVSQNSHENNYCGVSFNKAAGQKETPAQVISFGYCEIFKNTFFIEYLGWLLLRLVKKFAISRFRETLPIK